MAFYILGGRSGGEQSCCSSSEQLCCGVDKAGTSSEEGFISSLGRVISGARGHPQGGQEQLAFLGHAWRRNSCHCLDRFAVSPSCGQREWPRPTAAQRRGLLPAMRGSGPRVSTPGDLVPRSHQGRRFRLSAVCTPIRGLRAAVSSGALSNRRSSLHAAHCNGNYGSLP